MSKRKLLLADDSVTIQKVVNLTFADEGIEVIAVGDGDSAMEKLAEISPDLVMADVNMPGLNGYQICEQIKQSELLRHTPVILLVGSFEPFDEAEAARVGADDFLTKPFQSIRQLVNKVTVLLNSERGGEADERHLADTLEMDNPQMERVSESSPPVQFDDSGMDDEMIQTSQITNYALDESAKFETREPIADLAKTQPLTSNEMRDFDFSPVVEEEVEEESVQISDDETGMVESVEESPTAEVEEDNKDSVTDEIKVSEDTEEKEDTESAETSQFFVEEQFDETQQEVEAVEPPETEEGEAVEPSETEELGAETPETEEIAEPVEIVSEPFEEAIPMPEVASILQIDEGDLLELPPIESDFEDEEEEEYSTPAEKAAEFTQTETPASDNSDHISAELIEAIANKVLEKLSEKAVKEVAWEVVPQMTEIIVKKLAEEKLKD